jgi:putative ABC transport system permease protein
MGASDRVEISTPQEVRAASLAIFDRTFAITYALEAAAIVVGLLGISLSFSAQILARRREFGVLRHLGMTRSEIAAALGIEGALVTALGVAFGIGVGWLISLILVHVINRQSFHWTMETDMPWVSVAALALVVLCSATLTAVWSGRPATRGEAVHAVRQDW